MKHVLAEIARQTEQFARRPLFELMQGTGTLSDVRTLVPNLTFFVFSFQDLLRMNERQIQSPKLRELAKAHRTEDAGHELWFLADMKKLGVERDIGWVLGRPHRAVRECSFEMLAEAIRAESDYTRITIPLVLEATGDVFFKGIFRFCDRVGVEESLEYFSKPHWEVEVGHEIFGPEPQAYLKSIVIEDATRERLLASVGRMFVSLGNLVDHLHASIVNDGARVPHGRGLAESSRMMSPPMSDAFVGELERRSIPVSRDAAALEAASLDFGRVVRGSALGVISPRTHDEVQTTVEMARKHAVCLTPRTHGNSQSGQSVPVGGFALDLSQLSRVGAPDSERLLIECDAGASWRRVMSSCLEHGLIPKVMPMNLELSVGGTLSAGGVGASCHRYGTCAAAVAAVSFLTGAGDLVRCTWEQNADLFALALGGQGRCGILLSVMLELRRTTSRVQTSYLLYESVQECLASLPAAAARPEIEYAEAYCSSLFQGLMVSERGRRPLHRWFGGLQVTREVDGTTPWSDAWLEGLGWKEIVHHESDSIAGFSARYDMRFEMMRRSGDWNRPHPWFESFLPPSRAASVISQISSALPPFFGDGHRVFLLRVDQRLRYLSMPVAESGYAVAFAVLPTAIAETALPDALPILERLEELVEREGGKRYLSGWIANPGAQFWRRHYGSRYEDWTLAKLRHDPDGILSSALFANLDAELYAKPRAIES